MTILDRLLGRPQQSGLILPSGPPALQRAHGKSVTDLSPWSGGPPLHRYSQEPQQKAERFLQVYKCGWFYKAEKRISGDMARLDWSVSSGDSETDSEETELPRPDLDIPFDALSPIDQFQRLLERPNPFQTGRQLIQKTQIRRDMAGTAMWYLENGAGGGLPTAIYGISPARLWPARDRDGDLLGWVMDKNSQNPVPFDAEEIINFPTASADDGDGDLFGVGVVEAVWAQVPLTDLIARHATDLMTTGGPLAGMLWPKDRTLTEDEFNDAQRAWRSVASDPNAARRLLLFPEPMEWASGSATPSEIGMPDLAVLNRDEILTAFPLNPYILGVPHPSGMNASGEVKTEERRDYWEGTIEPRTDEFSEVIQTNILSRYEREMGQTFDFDMAIPNLDNAPGIIEKVGAFRGLVAVGFDPKEAIAAVSLNHIKWLGLPALLDPANQAAAAEAAMTVAAGDNSRRDAAATVQPVVAKPAPPAKARKTSRDSVTDRVVPLGQQDLTEFFTAQRERVAQRVADTLPKTKAARKADPGDWWDANAEDKALTDVLRGLYLEVGKGGLQVVADAVDKFVYPRSVKRILEDLLTYGGERITQINEGTRQAIAAQLAEGARRGYSINQLVDGVAAEGFPGVKQALLDNGVEAFGDYRAELISRTETMLSYNRAAVTGYREFGVEQVQAIDGDADAECASRDGHTFAIEEALAIEDHPNGTLDWVPVIEELSMDFLKAERIGPAKWRVLAIPFGGPFAGKDLDGEFFSANTDIKPDWFDRRPLVWQHNLDDTMKADPVMGTADDTELDTKDGWWSTVWLDRSHRYWAQVDALLQSGKIYGSSGSLPNFVKTDKKTGEILVWPYVEQTLTPTPANPYSRVVAAKAAQHFLEAGLIVPAQISDLDSPTADLPTDLPSGGDAAAMRRLHVAGEAYRLINRADNR